MTTFIGIGSVVPIEQMIGGSPEDAVLLRAYHSEATTYLKSFDWCRRIVSSFFGLGVGGIVGVFLFQIEPARDEDEWLWVVCGDLPSAYLVTDSAFTPEAALESYCELMAGWIDAVRGNASIDEAFPVAADATRENADALESRLAFLREELVGRGSSG